jgi:DNA polymerase-3 subunit delta
MLVFYYSGKIDRNSKLYQIFKSIKSAQLKEEEFKIKKGRELDNWVRKYLEKQGKSISPEALMALIDSTGNNLRILAKEIEKLCLYRPQTKNIDLEDVVALCPSVRGFLEYELVESLETGSPSRALQILSKLLDEASRAEIIVGAITQFFKDLLLAREWLEKGRDERVVFNELRPWIKESFGAFYELKKNQFLRAVFSLSEADLREAIVRLHSIDQAIKGGASDKEHPIFLTEFLFWYFERRKNKNSGQIS